MLKKYIPIILLFVIAFFLFFNGIVGDKHIVSYDNSPTEDARNFRTLKNSAYNSGWDNGLNAGFKRAYFPYNIRYFCDKIFSPVKALNMAYFISVFLAALFSYLLFRSHGFSMLASLLGGIGIMLNNHLITLVLPGHLGKMMAFAWLPLVFLFLRKGALSGNLRFYIFSGFFLGLSFQGRGYQISFYFAILTFFYFMYLVLKEKEGKILDWVKTTWKNLTRHVIGYIAMVLMTIMIAMIIYPGVKGHSASRKQENVKLKKTSQQKWDWATQWSLPPEEILDFFVPGVFGWKTGDKEAPYWGRLGKGGHLKNLKLRKKPENI